MAKIAVKARTQKEVENGCLDHPTYQIIVAAKIMERLTHREFAHVKECNYPQWRALDRIAQLGGATVREIADKAWADRAEVSRSIKTLEERGFIRKEENLDDLRAPINYVTRKGARLRERILKSRKQFHEDLTQGLSKGEIDALHNSLTKIINNLLEAYSGEDS